MKRILKWLGITFGGVVLLIVIASIVIMFVVDKPFVEEQMRSALNRHVTIKDINIGVFSVLSGIEVEEVKISNFKTAKALEALKGKPVPAHDLFVGLDSFKFKVKFGEILQGKVTLKELMLYRPIINIVRSPKGGFNFDDLTQSKPMTPEEKAELERQMREDAMKPSKPLKAEDIPLAVGVGKIGIDKGTVNFVDRQSQQSVQIYNFTVLIHSIKIDPKALDKENQVKLDLDMGIKTVGQIKSGSVESFDIGISARGKVIPFDVKTKILNPEVAMKFGSPYGHMTGLQILESLKGVEALEKYCGKLKFLGKDLKWKNGYVHVWYKGGAVVLKDGDIKTDDFVLGFGGKANTNTKAIDMKMTLLLAKKHNDEIRKGISKSAGLVITGAMKKYIKKEKVVDEAMKGLQNKDGKVYLSYLVRGTYVSPPSKLVAPKSPSMKDLVKKAAGGAGDIAKDKAKSVAKKQGKKAAKKGKKKLKKLF